MRLTPTLLSLTTLLSSLKSQISPSQNRSACSTLSAWYTCPSTIFLVDSLTFFRSLLKYFLLSEAFPTSLLKIATPHHHHYLAQNSLYSFLLYLYLYLHLLSFFLLDVRDFCSLLYDNVNDNDDGKKNHLFSSY